MKNILFINTFDNLGGAARVGWDLGNELAKHHYNVKYLVGNKLSGANNVYKLKTNPVLDTFDRIYSTKTNEYSYIMNYLISFVLANDQVLGAGHEILEHDWYRQADIVHLHNLHGNYFKFETLETIFNEKKVVWTLHDLWPITSNCVYCYDCDDWNTGNHYNYSWGKYGNLLWNNSKHLWNKKKELYDKSNFNIVTPSSWLKTRIDESILKHKKINTIHNSVNIDFFYKDDRLKCREIIGLPKRTRIILFIAQGGMGDPRKGGRYLLEIAKHYKNNKNILFLCIGGGTEKRQEENIYYIPFVNEPETLAQYYNSANMLLFTSLEEVFGLVLLEAYACGLPVVTFDVGAASDIFKHKENSYIAKYMDVKDLLRGIEFVFGLSQTYLSEMANINRERAVKEFSLPVMTKRYIKLYNSL